MPFYNLAEWQTARRQALHDAGYQCQRCGISLIGLGKRAHVHHRRELKRAPALRAEPQNLLPVCASCHNKEHAEKPRGACNIRGYPLDASHPWYQK